MLDENCTRRRTGIFGSAFNPPTAGHFDVLQQAASHFDKIVLLPSVAHAFHKPTLPLNQRLELIEAFCQDLAPLTVALEISRLEAELLAASPDQPVYTWTVLNALSEQEPETKFAFIRGPDNADPATWQRFYRYQDIERRWPIFTARGRVKARSSLVREQLSRSNPDLDLLTKWLTPTVMKLIVEQRLYRE